MYDVQHRYDDEGDYGGDGGSVMSMDEVLPRAHYGS